MLEMTCEIQNVNTSRRIPPLLNFLNTSVYVVLDGT